MDTQQIKALIDRYLDGKCTPEEKKLVEHFYIEEIGKQDPVEYPIEPLKKKEAMWKQISSRTSAPAGLKNTYRIFARYSAAAVVLLVCGIAAYFYLKPQVSKNGPGRLTGDYSAVPDIKPGGDKAVLTLPGGTNIVLNESKDGIVSKRSGVILKKQNNQLVCLPDFSAPLYSSSVSNNVISTPRGGQYKVLLSDGTKVWLNAASALHFPGRFTGNTRTVEVTGEAYFEVAKNKKRPFMVRTGKQTIEVLGTHFNLNAYQDEPSFKTTLLEGSVKVSSGKGMVIIKPGEEANVDRKVDRQIYVAAVNTDETMAWKNNKLKFSSKPLDHIMRQISRWYDVDIEYEGDVSGKVFTGSISKYSNVSQVLKMLELTTLVHFKIEERRITVMP